MARPTEERVLQALLTTVGLVAMATGAFALITGSGGMPGEIEANATVESELRYFAAFWIAYGAIAFRTAPRVATATVAVRALALAMFIGGLGRALAWIDVGRPHGSMVVLMVIELVLPALLVFSQQRAARAST